MVEIEQALPHQCWTLVGGLMTQLHAAAHGIDSARPTDDIDMVLHIETTPGAPSAAATALESLGYALLESIDPRENTAHRFRRGRHSVDLVASEDDVVDVLVADHPAPRVMRKLCGRDMVAIEGGTQALGRTMNATLVIADGHTTTVSVPSVLGALVLKAAAYQTDSRDPQRHLVDACVLLACLDDPYAAREEFKGSDRARLGLLGRNLPDDSPVWRLLDRDRARNGQAALRILTAGLP
ncbi:nucleotidyl transferase AbiEii/AbiGii toxin family protein [Cellulomonas sp. S1-8]|uniref:nucleotidyl transferase AbiEii/AbiGii toxin family protein n=1 Tax=Cellulomonas sp. S1-8 TaxID=2904790 RepID=UPI0022447803|nr:nucleotidyl transferase AbiEii/AbiGii toxin family protein [Cellulomonas sp. S1-8]UZN02529.1 hypothetical protein OKX07_15930 [Cellulomonas sp. S1-8]